MDDFENYIVDDWEMRMLILQDAPEEVQKDYEIRDRESEWAPREEMLRRRTGVLFWADWLEGWMLKLPQQKTQYFFRTKTPTHYINVMHALREAKEIEGPLAKPKARNRKKLRPL